MQLETEFGIHDRDAEIADLRTLLGEACSLLRVEERAYRENDHEGYTKLQRNSIADTLAKFCEHARRVTQRYPVSK